MEAATYFRFRLRSTRPRLHVFCRLERGHKKYFTLSPGFI